MRCANKRFSQLLPRFAALIAVASLASCSAPPRAPGPAAQQASAAARLGQIPAADAARYDKPSEVKAWKNPYLIIRPENVGLVDRRNNEIRILKPEEVSEALAELAPAAWPYGRVVAIQENAAQASPADAVQIRANRGVVAGALESMQVAIEWIPSN